MSHESNIPTIDGSDHGELVVQVDGLLPEETLWQRISNHQPEPRTLSTNGPLAHLGWSDDSVC